MLERFCAARRYRYLYPEGPNLAILLEAYQELDRLRVVGRVGPGRRSQRRALRRIIGTLARRDALARNRRLRWRYPPPRIRPSHVRPSLVRRALSRVDHDVRRFVRARIEGHWADPDPSATLVTEAIAEQRGLEQFRDALVNEALAHPDGLARLHPQFLLFAASGAPRIRRYPIASFWLVKVPMRLVAGVMALLVLLYLSAFAFLNDERLGSLVSGQVSALVEGDLEIERIHWELPLIVDLLTGTPTHVVAENVSVWEPHESFGGERTRRTAWAERIEMRLTLHEIIPWNRLGVPAAVDIPWVLHMSEVRSDGEAWFVVREYDDVDDTGQTRTLLSLIDAFRTLEPPDADRRGVSFRIDDAQFARALLDVDFMHGLSGWRTGVELRDLAFDLRYDAPTVEQGTPVELPLRFDVQGRALRGHFRLDDIEVPIEKLALDQLSCGMQDAPVGTVQFAGRGLFGDSPTELEGALIDAFTRRIEPDREPLALDAVVTYGDLAHVQLVAGSREPQALVAHLEQQLGLAYETLSADRAEVWARVEGPLSDPHYHLAAEGLALDFLGEPAWTMDDVQLSVTIADEPVPARWQAQLPDGAIRRVARFETFRGAALDGAFVLDPKGLTGGRDAMVVFPDHDESYLINAPLRLEGINPAQLSPDDPELAHMLQGTATGRLDLAQLVLGPEPDDALAIDAGTDAGDDAPEPDEGEADDPDDPKGTDPADASDEGSAPDADRDDELDEDVPLGLRRAELTLADVLLERDHGPGVDGLPRRLRADGTIRIGPDGAIDLDDLVVRTDGTTLRATGGVDGSMRRLDDTRLALDISDGAAFSRAFDLERYFDTLHADMTVRGSTTAPDGRDGNLTLAGVGVQDGTTTQATLRMDRGVLHVHAPNAHLYGGTGTVDADVTLFERGALREDPKLRATVALRDVELADLPLAREAGLSGLADVEVTIGDAEGQAVPMSRLEVRGEARVPRLRFAGTRYRDAVVRFSLGPESLVIEELVLPVHRAISPFHEPDVSIPIGKLVIRGSVGLQADPALDLQVEADGVPLRLVASLLDIDAPVRGRIGEGTALTVTGTVQRPSVAGKVMLSGLSAEGIALGSGLLEVTSQDLARDGPLAAHRELRVGGELATPDDRDGGIHWTLDAVVAIGEKPRGRRGPRAPQTPPIDAEVDVRFDRIALSTLLRGLTRGTGTTPAIHGRLDMLGAHVLTCNPSDAMLTTCLGDRSERSLEVSLQLDDAWIAGREPTTTDPCKDPVVLCTDSSLDASIDGTRIALSRPWRWRTGGAEPAALSLTGELDLSTPKATAPEPSAESGADQCRPPGISTPRLRAVPDGVARAEVHGTVDLAVVAELLHDETLRRAHGRLDVDLSLQGPAADAHITGRVTLPDETVDGARKGLELDLSDLDMPLRLRDLDLRIDDHWLVAQGQLEVVGETIDFGTVRGDHTGFAFAGPCEGHWGVAASGSLSALLINRLLDGEYARKGGVEVPQLIARGHMDAPTPVQDLQGTLRVGRSTLTLDIDEGLPPVELTAGRVNMQLCHGDRCPPEIAEGALALRLGGETGPTEGRPSDAVRAKIGPRGSAYAWGTGYLAPDYASLDGTRIVVELEDVPYRGYDQRGRPVYEAELSSPAIKLDGGVPLVVRGDIEVDRARYVQDAVQGVEMLRFTDDVDLPSAPPPEIVRNLQFDLKVQTRTPLRVENNVAHGVEANAVLDITGTYDTPEFTGRVDVEPGGTVDIPFLTGTYEIQRGRVTLLRELADAEVDVLALRKELVYIDDQPRRVYLLLGGTAEAITWQCIAEGDTSGAVETQRGCLDYLVLGAGDVQTSALTVQRTGGGGLANARKPLQVVGHVTEFDFGRRIEEAVPRFGPYVPDLRLRLGQIGPELEIATPEEWLDFDYAHGTAALDYTRGYPGFLLQQSRELTFKLEAIDLLIFEVSRDIRSYLNNRIIFDPLRQTTVEFRVDFEIPSMR